ncbi:MAG: DUF1874 domain-containing protein [Ignavibacteria bacterium]|nr:DUF1874 domain-containing protein [Ignavibacteria bacterium]
MKVMCSAVMPQAGKYTIKELTAEEFGELLKKHANGGVEYHIGFENTASLIERITGLQIPGVNKQRVRFKEPKDEALVVTLKEDFYDKHKKHIKKKYLKPENCNFWHVTYTSTN